MRCLSTLLVALTAVPTSDLAAQASLTTTFDGAWYLASSLGGVYFDLTVLHDLQLERLDLNLLAPAGAPVAVDVFVRPGTWREHVRERGDWVRLAHGNATAAGAGRPTVCVLDAPIGLPPGGCSVALHVQGAMPIYTWAFGPRTFASADLALTAGGSAQHFLASEPFVWRVWNGTLHYARGGGPFAMAVAEPYGAGCGAAARSFYEWFAPGGLDLAHQSFALRPNAAGGFDVARGPAVPVVLPNGAQNLGLLRGGAAFVPLATPIAGPAGPLANVLVLADGRVLLTDRGLLGAASGAPGPAALFADAPMLVPAWLDLAPVGARNVYAVQDAGTGATTIVWWDVPAHGDPAALGNTFACVLHADGRIDFHLGAIANPVGAVLVGIGGGRGALDPGPRDLSAASAFATGADVRGMELRVEGRPVLGTTTTMSLGHVPPAAAATFLVAGWSAEAGGVDLRPYGAPGCRLHVGIGDSAFVPLAPAGVAALAVPSAPALVGASLFVQGAAVVVTAAGPGGVVTSARALTVGTS
jgi:hypothetical protein